VPQSKGRPANEVFTWVAEQVLAEHPDDEQGRMLHSPGLKTGGKFYAFAANAEDLMVKLPAARVQEIIAEGLGVPCETRPGRPMREWVQITAPDETSCWSYVLEARSFLTGDR
jgi:hypothetical protein